MLLHSYTAAHPISLPWTDDFYFNLVVDRTSKPPHLLWTQPALSLPHQSKEMIVSRSTPVLSELLKRAKIPKVSPKFPLDLLRYDAQQPPKFPKIPAPVDLKAKGFAAADQLFPKIPSKMLCVTTPTSRGNSRIIWGFRKFPKIPK